MPPLPSDTVYDEAYGYEIAFSYRDVPDEIDCPAEDGRHDADIGAGDLLPGPPNTPSNAPAGACGPPRWTYPTSMCKRAAENATTAGVALDVIHGDMLDFSCRTRSIWPFA